MDDSGINPQAAGQPGRHDQRHDAATGLSNDPRPGTGQPGADQPGMWPPYPSADPYGPDDGTGGAFDGDFGHRPEVDQPAPWPPMAADSAVDSDTPPRAWPPPYPGAEPASPAGPTSPATGPAPMSPAAGADGPGESAGWPPEGGDAHSAWAPFPSAPQHSPGAWAPYPDQPVQQPGTQQPQAPAPQPQNAPPSAQHGVPEQSPADPPTAQWPVEEGWPQVPEPPAIDPFGPPPGTQPPGTQQPPPPQPQQMPPQRGVNGQHGAPSGQPDQPAPQQTTPYEQPQPQQPQQQPPQGWQQGYQQQPGPQQQYSPYGPGPLAGQQQYPQTSGVLGGDRAPTADDFAQRRAARPPEPVANQGLRRAVRLGSLGLVKMGPGRKEQEQRHAIEMVRRNFGGLRQITVINPKGGAGKTVAVLMIAMTLGQKRGGYVLAWDNNETQGTLGMRAAQDFHNRTVRDLLRDLAHFRGPTGRVGDLSQYVRAQGEAMFDVLASDESATAGEMLTALAFVDIRDVVSRFYKLIVVDTGNNVRAANWQAAIDATDQLVVCMSARNDSAETAARALDHLEQTGRHDLVRRAVTVVSMPAHRKDLDLPAVQRHFSARTRAVLLAPYEKLLDSGEPIRYGGLSQASRDAWLKIAAAVAEGL